MEPGEERELALSRAIAFCLLLLYLCYVVFQLVTHSKLFDECEEETPCPKVAKTRGSVKATPTEQERAIAAQEGRPEEEEEETKLPLGGALAMLCLVTVAIAAVSEIITGAIEGAAEAWDVNPTFVVRAREAADAHERSAREQAGCESTALRVLSALHVHTHACA